MNTLDYMPPIHRPSNPTPLDLTIHRYEQLAREFHYNKAKYARKNESKVKRAARQAAFERDWNHLEKERIRISAVAMVSLQEGLDDYREENKSKTRNDLREEPHHPTEKLANNLRASHEPKPSLDHDAHHIVMGKGRWRQGRMMRARLSLHMHKIGINDPINGVWLPRNKKDKGHWATPDAPAHKEIHRYNYETWITNQIGGSPLKEETIRNRLTGIKQGLKYGGYPIQIILPKDVTWDGNE